MKIEKIKVLVLLISFVSVLSADFKLMDFKELTRLASEDLHKNIYIDRDLPKYSVEVNLADYQKKGEVSEFYKIVLFENDLFLQYNRKGDFYFVKQKLKEIVAPEPIPVHKTLKLHYYTYRIKNITNDDVVASMSIFPNVKFSYLKQSDIIAYSATRSDHEQVKKILKRSDNKVLHSTIKISLFAVNKTNLKQMGASIESFGYGINTQMFKDIIDSFRNGHTDMYSIAANGFDIDFMFHALKGHSVIDMFQAPTMRLTNGIKSSVSSVVNIPYLRTTSTVDSTTNSVIEQYEYKDVGLQIKVNPKMKKDWVFIELDLISDELISLDDDRPITQKITYKNSVRVAKGKPILLTGIKKTSQKFTRDGVPYLEDIPVLGYLFKGHSTETKEQNINILIEVL